MCGIVGLWNKHDPQGVKEMMSKIKHRGPDASGTFDRGSGLLGHRRLSIMDPVGGNQPILSEGDAYAIVANGEIYNFPKLYSELASSHEFRTRNDSESILHLYEDMATESAKELDGMFAFVISDGNELFAARDTVGIKPLYMAQSRDRLAFASELKAFSGEFANDVREFPPGSFYHSATGLKAFRPIVKRAPVRRTVEEYCGRIRDTLSAAVEKRLMSDVPLGAFLSGGLDSSIIVALMKQHRKTLHTFSVGLEGSSDLEAARLVSEHVGTVHHEYTFRPEEVVNSLPEVIYHLESFDQDLVRSAIPCYFTSRLAAEHVKVILTGEGADELFAGYTYCKDIHDEEALHNELHRSVTSLHNINLQRVDRLTMAHSLEGRVPFLDLELIDTAQEIPASLKLYGHGEKRTEKWILRKAFEDLLPTEIVWRDKEQFDEGSGTVDIVEDGLSRYLSDDQAAEYAAMHPEHRLRSHEECVYHKLLADVYEDSDHIMKNTGRWAER